MIYPLAAKLATVRRHTPSYALAEWLSLGRCLFASWWKLAGRSALWRDFSPHCMEQRLFYLCLLFAWASAAGASIPSPEKLLPDDTLVMVTVPDYSKLREITRKLPLGQLWTDPAMKPFREHLASKWTEEFLKPLEHDLDVKLDDYASLLQGQLTFALTQNGWQGASDQEPGLLLLLDARDKSGLLKKNLAEVRKKWADAGKTLRTQKIRDIEFTVLSLSSNDTPKTLRKFFPPSSPVQELNDDKDNAKAGADKRELVLGQFESLLIVGNAIKPVEKIATRLTGGSSPCLGEMAAYQASQLTLFRDSPLFGWVNASALVDTLIRATAKKENPDAPNPFDLKPDKIIGALGFAGLKTLAFSLQDSSEGTMLQVSIGVPEAARQGLFKILAGEAKETSPPPFVPADAVKFQRWRIDGQKTWATLQKIINEISPQWLNGINFLMETANTAAKEKDPGFDLKKNLIGNLGDDMVSFEKASKAGASGDIQPPSSLFLLGSPNPEQLAGALKSILVYVSQQAGAPPEEREFLGRKIYSVPMRPMGFPGAAPTKSTLHTLHYAASGGYVAFSTDVAMIEGYLRSSESQGKTLREIPGLNEAAQKVTGPGANLFGYENQLETIRTAIETLRKTSGLTANTNAAVAAGFAPGALGVASAGPLKEWFDFSLLPPFEQLSKYFYFSVYGGSASVEGLSFKFYSPKPPAIKRGA